MSKKTISLYLFAVGAILVSQTGPADARTVAASVGTATIVGGTAAASCLANTYEGSTNSCASGHVDVEWPFVIDNGGTKNFAVTMTNQGICWAFGLTSDGSGLFQSANATGVAGQTYSFGMPVNVPSGGYAYVACHLSGTGLAGGATQIHSINVSNP